jgi:ankyrin repeat protein
MLNSYFKKKIYIIVFTCFSYANAGSYDDFFLAITNDRASFVTDLLQRGFDPNTRDAKGQPGLIVALQNQSLKAVQVLVASPDIDVNLLNQAGESALMIAALKGDFTSAQLLLDHGAKVNMSGWSPLHYAATGPNAKVTQLLIEHGAELNAASPNGTTPLMMAAQYGNEQNVFLLLDRGADPTRRNQQNLGVLDFAKLSGRAPVVTRLEQGPH